jgi:hypothetical protein
MAKGKRSFSPSEIREKKDDYHGYCRVSRLPPNIADKNIRSVNMSLTFEEALRLSTALQSAILKLNRYNRSATSGKKMGLVLSLKTQNKMINVIEKKV